MEFIWVPSGCFTMGSPEAERDRSANEVPHQVCPRGFWMGKYEVTNAQYQRFDANHDSGSYESYALNGTDQPVVRVSWQEAVAYADWLSAKTGSRFRLPTEAEWEYAARGGKTNSRYWGDDPNQACRYANIYDETARKAKPFNWANYPCEDGQVVVAPVGKYAPNGFGLYDLLGNVAEWTCSEYDNAYAGGETRCADRSVATGGRRVLRGGSWSDYPGLVRFAYRFPAAPEYRKFDLGFRLVLEP
jgi:formylglycine-generating enzyme required for sulfatase activity